MAEKPAHRQYTSRRAAITKALAESLAGIDGRGIYHTAVAEVSPRLKFWDEVEEFPAIHLNAGSETREYQGGGYKDRFLNIYDYATQVQPYSFLCIRHKHPKKTRYQLRFTTQYLN